MKSIGVRQLRQNASAWLREVEAGESFEITDRGRPVALLVPVPGTSLLERLQAAGKVSIPRERSALLRKPAAPTPGRPLPSEVLEQMRADER